VLEGIEAIMFRTIGDGPSLWESRLPPEVLRLPEDLARVDVLLDDPVFFAPFAPFFHPVLGRPSTPVECYLRLMFLKFRHRLGYESLCAEVSDSISWRRFCRIPLDGTVPHPTTLMKLTSRCGEQAVAGLNEALWAKAAAGKLLRTARVRADTTVICANVAYPTDSGLLAKAVGKLVRTARRVQAAGGAPDTVMTDRRRAAARRVREIASKLRAWRKISREETTRAICRVTGELAGLADKAAAEAAAVLRNGRRAVPKALSGRVRGRLVRALGELAVTIERTAAIVAQTRSRLAGQLPASATPLVSQHDPDARPIRKGRIDRPAGVRVQGPGQRQRRRRHPRLHPRIRRRSRRPAAGPRHRPHPPPCRPGTPRRHRRPRLRPRRRRARPARPRRAHRRYPTPGHHFGRPQDDRAQPQLPPSGQMAHRLRRTDQLPQTRLRLGPDPPGPQARSRNLVRARRLHSQPGQDRRPRQLTSTRQRRPAGHLAVSPVPNLTASPFSGRSSYG
jgi:IS5 family transposase